MGSPARVESLELHEGDSPVPLDEATDKRDAPSILGGTPGLEGKCHTCTMSRRLEESSKKVMENTKVKPGKQLGGDMA